MTPLESNFLVPNASFLVALFLVMIVLGLVTAGTVWLVMTLRRGTTPDR